jgi:hypothetical protein
MNARILYAGVPLAIAMLSGGASAQSVVAPGLTQDQQTTVYRTIVRDNAVAQTQAGRKQSRQIIRQSKQVIRKPGGNIVRTTTTERIVTRPAPVAVAPVARQRVIAPQPATTLVTADPLDLTPDQRTFVYRTIVQQPLQPAPIVTERVVPAPLTRPFVTTEPVVTTAPQVQERVITVPQTTGVGTVISEPVITGTEIVIGSRIPASVPLYAMPASAVAAAPSIEAYRYALIGDRVYLVDPRDGIVVGMLYQ